MKTRRLDKTEVEVIVQMLTDGGMVAIPTDTVYGLAISSKDEKSYTTLKVTKGRPDDKPFPLMVSSIEQLESIVEMDDATRHLVETFMPGPVTFIFNKRKDVFPFLGESATLGVRIADDAWVQDIITKNGYPVWLPSANLSGYETGVTSENVLDQLDGLIDGVVIGRASGLASSSVFDIHALPHIVNLRQGPVSLETLEKSYQEYLDFDHKSDTITNKKGV